MFKIDLKTTKKTAITKAPLGNLDGIELDGNGGYWVSDWVAGKVFRISAKGEPKEVVSGIKGCADIGFMADKHILLVPAMGENRILAFETLTTAVN